MTVYVTSSSVTAVIERLVVYEGADVNEVEAAGNTWVQVLGCWCLLEQLCWLGLDSRWPVPSRLLTCKDLHRNRRGYGVSRVLSSWAPCLY